MKLRRSPAPSTSTVRSRTTATPRATAPGALATKQPLDGFDAPRAGPGALLDGTSRTRKRSSYDLTNHGGKVLSRPEFQPLYVGSYWTRGAGATDRAYNDAFAKDLVKGNHEALLSQYGVGEGSFAPSTVVSGASPKTFSEADVVALVKKQIASGAVKDGPQTVHMVVLPPGTVLTSGNVDSTQGLGGFHGSYVDAKGKSVYFGVVCYSQGNNGIDFTGTGRRNVTITESHEFDEAATDPDVMTGKVGWYNAKYGEIGDLAVNSGLVPLDQAYGKDSGGYDVQVEWSNKDGKFLVGK